MHFQNCRLLQKNLLHAAIILILTALPAVHAFPQTNTGRLVGSVLDSSGGVLPDTAISIIDNLTGKERSTVTDDMGNFQFSLLDIGSYTLNIQRAGFNPYSFENLIIEVGRESFHRAVLIVGSEDFKLTVYADSGRLDATTAELSNTISANQIRNLPLIDRDPLDLILLQAGTSYSLNQNTSINGQRTAFTNITRDGINIQDALLRTNATDFVPGRPSVDDVEEFTIITQNALADRGYGSVQVSLVTPRGSNEFHGGVWIYNRHSAFGANNFFSNKAGLEKPSRNRNQIGGKIGGVVPKTGEKLFFFAFYEALRDNRKQQANRTLLLPDARNGIFTYIDNLGATRSVDLLSLTPEIIEIDPTIESRFLSKMPTEGNRSDLGDQLNTTGILINQPRDEDRDTFTARIDYHLAGNQNINFVYSRNKETIQRADINDTEGFYSVHPVTQSSTNNLLTVAHRWFKSPAFSNELRGGFFFSEVPFDRTIDAPDFFIVPGSNRNSDPYFSNPEVTFLNQGRDTRHYNLQNHSEKLFKRHSIRFGGQMQLFQGDPYNYYGIVPTFQTGVNSNTPQLTPEMFEGGISSTQLNNANSLFSYLGGILSSGSQSFNVKDKDSGFQVVPKFEDYRYSNYSFYITDQWRATPELTLNIGLRYELFTPVRLLNGLALEPVISGGTDPMEAILDPDGYYDYVGGNAGGGNRLYKNDWNDLAPVVSFAYSPEFTHPVLKAITGPGAGTFVIRGGYRRSYVNDSFFSAARNASFYNYGLGTTDVNATNPSTGTTELNARIDDLPAILPPEVMVPRTYADNNTPFGTVFATDPEIQTTRVDEYNIGIQRSLGWDTVLEVRYVGSRSDNLWRAADYNQVDIRNNGFAEDFNRARRNLLTNNDPEVGETLTVFPLLNNGGLLSIPAIQSYLLNGIPADMATFYVITRNTGSVDFLPNPSTGVADLLNNSARYRYNSLQIDVRKRFGQGFSFQANYTWQKVLTDSVGTTTGQLDVYLDLENKKLEYTRADYDLTHVFNFNSVFDLPVGKGKRFGSGFSPAANHILGDWRVSGFLRITSGVPVTIVDPRGTLNRQGRSARQTPDLSISHEQLRDLTGRFVDGNSIYFINPSVINPATGRAAEGYGTDPFPGQVFFNAAPGQTGSMGRALVNGPHYFNIDMALMKNIRFMDDISLQLRLEAFNMLNHTNFYLPSQQQNINSTNFGKLQNTWPAREVQIAARLEF